VLFVGHPGGFTPSQKSLAAWFIQSTGTIRLKQAYPTWSIRSIFDCPDSPFCLPRDKIEETSIRYLQEGELFSFYLGHSSPQGLWSDGLRYLTREEWAKLKIPRGQGVYFTCSCHACQLEGKNGEGYGIYAMRNPNGPTAVIGAHDKSYSAMGQLALAGIMPFFSKPPESARLADYWLLVQEGLERGKIEDWIFRVCDMADGSNGLIPLDVQRKEHMEMWMLLGDPALKLTTVLADIRLKTADAAIPGKTITVNGTLPERLKNTKVCVTLERSLESSPADLPKLPEQPSKARDELMVKNHLRANDFVLTRQVIEPNGIEFSCTLDLPKKLPWPRIVVKAYAENESDAACGAIFVEKEAK
jgi:hypothetical protein